MVYYIAVRVQTIYTPVRTTVRDKEYYYNNNILLS